MEAGNDDDLLAEDAVEDLVWEASKTIATSVSPMNLIGERCGSYCVFTSLNRRQKLGAKPRPVSLVPRAGLLYIGRSLGPVDETLHEDRLRIRVCSS